VIPFREKGVPSVLQIEDKEADFNPYYHSVGDTVDHMDADYFTAHVRAVAAIAYELLRPLDEPATATATATSPPAATATTTPTASATPGAPMGRTAWLPWLQATR
jgi:Zn-dependent M28 family amino/carboxypeptidase